MNYNKYNYLNLLFDKGVNQSLVKPEREDFNPMELARGLAKRKDLYEFEHPEIKVGQFGNKGGKILEKTESDISRFTQETAKAIGKSETFVKEHLQLN